MPTGDVAAVAPAAPVASVAATPAATLPPPLERTLTHGTAGSDVAALQARLIEIGFDPGPKDGIFGGATTRSVWAYEKLILGIDRTEMHGEVTPEMWDRMSRPTEIQPRRSPGGTHLEVYLPEQVAVIFNQGSVRLVSHISSGDNQQWCDEVLIDKDDGTTEVKGICGLSVTPGGVYHFERQIDGWRNGKLGRLYKPVYFNYGIAIHGAGNVPSYPASHGCVRFPMHIAEYMQDIVSIGDAVYVFDGVEEPEVYGAQPMRFDWPDPDWTPPSTTTTTTSTTTTTPPTTTMPAHAPQTTTTPTPTTTTTTTTSTTAPPTTMAPTTVTQSPDPDATSQ
jgi:hypothetical protein